MANLTTDNLKTVDDLDFIDSANLSSGFLLGGEGSTLKKFSYEQLKNSVGSIAVVPVSTEEDKTIGELWIENEIVNVQNVLHSHSEIGLMDTTKKNQVACINNYLYVLNANGKLFKIDLENKICEALYSDLVFNFIFVNETLIVFVGSNGANTKAINFKTNVEYSCPTEADEIGSQDEIFSQIEKYTNFSYPLNKYNRFTINQTGESTIALCNFIIYNNFLIAMQDTETVDNSFSYLDKNITDYAITLMYYSEYDGQKMYYSQIALYPIENNTLNPFGDDETKIENVSAINDYHICLIPYEYQGKQTAQYNGIIVLNNSKTHYRNVRVYIENDTDIYSCEEKEFYSDEKILSEIIALKHFYCGFFTLQKTTEGNRFAVVKYSFTTDGLKCEVVNIIEEENSYTELDLLCDLESEKKYYQEEILNPEFICAGNNATNFVAEKITPEYNSKLKIKLPSGIKTIGVE